MQQARSDRADDRSRSTRPDAYRPEARTPGSIGMLPPPEHSACGVGFVVSTSADHTRTVVKLALSALERLEHRGGLGADGESSDGAGILASIPWRLYRPWLVERGVWGAAGEGTAVGMVFLPRDEGKRRISRDLVEMALHDEGLAVVGWRPVPTHPDVLSAAAEAHRPEIEQVFATSPLSGDELERALLLARRRIGRTLASQRLIRRLDDLYLCSLSGRTIVYKGMLSSALLPRFYEDLTDPDFVSHFAVFHRRFSTNTLPTWSLAQPMRLLAHNGEINTLSGNLAWMRAREGDLSHPIWGDRMGDLLPPIHGDSSDSGALDKMLEFLVRSGRTPFEALMVLMPEAYEHDRRGGQRERIAEFYDYYSGVQEAWDGPAMVAFGDGDLVGACVDRNGLRPARYALGRSGILAVASEAGAVLDVEDVVERGRLGPGEMIAVDLTSGEVHRDEAIKRRIAAERPYGTWVRQQRRSLSTSPFPETPLEDAKTLLRRQVACGYSAEDVEAIIRPMAESGREPRFAMGNDAPLAILSSKPHTLYDYFAERFAQVTNPPIDPLRERLVMSLSIKLGRRGNLLTAEAEHARQVEPPSPVLNEADLAAVEAAGLETARVSTGYDITTGPWGLREAVERLCAASADAVRSGAEIVVLSDRVDDVGVVTSHAPPLLAVGAAHHRLLHEGLRGRASLVVETGQCWSIHHLACLIGYGAAAVAPYLAFETIRHLWSNERQVAGTADEMADDTPAEGPADRPPLACMSVEQAQLNYRLSAERGLLKILSKMGISLLASYHGAQLFEALGIGDDLLALAFAGTPSRIGGLSLEELARETVWTHQRAFPELTAEKLENYGFIRYRRGGEYHLNNPEAAKTLRRACVENSGDLYDRYRERLAERPPTVLRDLLRLKSDRAPIAFDEVEPAREIARRFSTGGMSMGALSREAHETLAIAMNRIDGRANSGEGGEDVARYVPIDDVNGHGSSARFPHLRGLRNGDVAVSRIKQVASGRFGVTPEYLASAEQLEIKIAQGAKPGEGGELPGNKVTAYIASLRRSKPGATLISPPPHHDIYSIEDLAQLVHDLREVNPSAEISVKLVAGWGVGTIAVGVAKAGADVIHVSGHGGGTAAASLNSIRHAGIPWELGLVETHRTLVANGLRTGVRLRVDGDLRTGSDIATAALLGADEFAFGTAVLMAEGCVMARVCHTNRCPVGIATQDEQLRERFAGEPQHIVNFFTLVAEEVRSLLAGLGYRALDEVVGRADLLAEDDRADITKTAGIDLAWMCTPSVVPGEGSSGSNGKQRAGGNGDRHTDRTGDRRDGVHTDRNCDRAHGAGPGLDERLLADTEVRAAIAGHCSVERSACVTCADRAVGTRIAGAIARAHGDARFRGDVRLELRGSAGQSLGAFLLDGMSLDLEGEANDYVGKGMAGGSIVLRPPASATGNGRPTAEGNGRPHVVAGNTCLYGATGGTLLVAGAVGERFAVRNSGGSAVIEGAGDHCCEYMTGGVVVVLGPVGRNACAGMTGGTAYFLDDGALSTSLNAESVVSGPDTDVTGPLEELLRAHLEHTRSERAREMLADWPRSARRLVRVTAR